MKKLILVFSLISLVSVQTFALPQAQTDSVVKKILVAKAQLVQAESEAEAHAILSQLKSDIELDGLIREAVIERLAELGELSQAQADDFIAAGPPLQNADIAQVMSSARGNSFLSTGDAIFLYGMSIVFWVAVFAIF